MRTKVVRVWAEDVERVHRLRELPKGTSLAVKLHVVLNEFERNDNFLARCRRVVREEFERIQVAADEAAV